MRGEGTGWMDQGEGEEGGDSLGGAVGGGGYLVDGAEGEDSLGEGQQVGGRDGRWKEGTGWGGAEEERDCSIGWVGPEEGGGDRVVGVGG